MTIQYASLASVLALGGFVPTSLAQDIPFDLLEITDDKLAPEFPGVDFEYVTVGFEESEGAGCAVMDYNNDGLLDLYLPNTEFNACKLYQNVGGGKFVDMAPTLGLEQFSQRRGGGLFVDVENDGDMDLLTMGYPGYTANQDLFSLFRNNGSPAFDFTDVTSSAGDFQLAPTADPTLLGDYGGSAGGDYNSDGYIDFCTTYFGRLPGYLYDQMRLWRNDPNSPKLPGQTDWSKRQFIDATITSGLDAWYPGGTWMPSFLDYNRDGHLDLHLNVDYAMDILRLNDGAGAFGPDICTSVGLNGIPAETRNEMGVCFGDIDFDGDLDQFNANAYWGDRFYRNDSVFGAAGAGMDFVDFAPQVGADQARMGWGCTLADMDNDMDLDLLRVAGLTTPHDNWLHINRWPKTLPDGVTTMFTDASKKVLEFSKLKANPNNDRDIGRALIPWDFDNDGDLDLVETRPGNSPYILPGIHVRAALYENTLDSDDNWVQLDLRGKNGSRNVSHSRVYLRAGGVTQMKQVLTGESFAGQKPDRLHFGLRHASAVDWVLVVWPDGTLSAKGSLPVNQVNTFQKGPVDLLGDVNMTGKVDAYDVAAHRWLLLNPVLAQTLYGNLPYKELGDMNGDNVFDSLDFAILDALVP